MPLQLTTKRRLGCLLLAAALAAGSAQAAGEDPATDTGAATAEDARPQREHAGPPRKRLSPEERAALRKRYENMSEEDKQAMREKRAERRAKWEAMSDEERKAAREKLRQRREARDRSQAPADAGAEGVPDGS